MSLHLVTGYKGEAHITATDAGALNAGMFGTGEYVLDSGMKFEASVLSSNSVRILDGDLMMQGRHITLKKGTSEDITINNGTVGMNRNDLIVVRYTKDAVSGVENAEFAVIQGTATKGTAADPDHTTGDILSGNCVLHEMPLYRIPLTELVVGTPEPLFNTTGVMGNSLLFRGWNPLKSKAEDTPKKWKELGTGFWMIDIADIIIGQPNQYGFLYNTVCYGEISQIFVAQADGATYRRNANEIGWYGTDWKEGTWRLISDEETRPVKFGEYWGDGTFGKDFPKSLTFNFVPKFVAIRPTSGYEYCGVNLVNGQAGAMVEGSTEATIVKYIHVEWSGKTVKWWNSSARSDEEYYGQRIQQNVSGWRYVYFAIG